MATEKTLQVYTVKKCTSYGMLVYKFSSPSRAGVPDLLVVRPDGVCFFIEVKHPNKTGRLSVKQLHEIERLKNNNVQVYIVNSREGADRVAADNAYEAANRGD